MGIECPLHPGRQLHMKTILQEVEADIMYEVSSLIVDELSAIDVSQQCYTISGLLNVCNHSNDAVGSKALITCGGEI